MFYALGRRVIFHSYGFSLLYRKTLKDVNQRDAGPTSIEILSASLKLPSLGSQRDAGPNSIDLLSASLKLPSLGSQHDAGPNSIDLLSASLYFTSLGASVTLDPLPLIYSLLPYISRPWAPASRWTHVRKYALHLPVGAVPTEDAFLYPPLSQLR